MELFICIFLILISLIICFVLVILNEYKHNIENKLREVENERSNNKSTKS